MTSMISFKAAFSAAAAVLVSAAACAAGGQQPDGAKILSRAMLAFDDYNTYQVEMLTSRTGPAGNFAMTSEMKLDRKAHRAFIRMSGNLFGQPMTTTVVDDGRTLITYNKERNIFNRGPHAAMTMAFPLKLVNQMLGPGSVSFLKSDTLGGRKVYILKRESQQRFGPGKAPKTLMYFDQATGRFLQLTMTGQIQMKEGAKPETIGLTVFVRNEVVNGAIPDSVFRFTPPVGAKQSEGGRLGMGPMLPGMMGGAMGPQRPPNR